MTSITGHLRKMQVTANTEDHTVVYTLKLGEHELQLNELLGQQVTLRHTGAINCVHCGRPTRKSFAQGYCYPCFSKLAECDSCIMSPEKCHFAEGTCRDPAWGQQHCMQQHHVYLANSSGLKVGLTRDTPQTRWIDQGALQAMIIARVATRQLAGFVEETLRQHISDRTQWQRMLKGEVERIDLPSVWRTLREKVAADIHQLQQTHGEDSIELLEHHEVTEREVTELSYPVQVYPTKVKSLNFDKTPELGGVLEGIKGQYLIFDSGVINIRKFGGYEVELHTA